MKFRPKTGAAEQYRVDRLQSSVLNVKYEGNEDVSTWKWFRIYSHDLDYSQSCNSVHRCKSRVGGGATRPLRFQILKECLQNVQI